MGERLGFVGVIALRMCIVTCAIAACDKHTEATSGTKAVVERDSADVRIIETPGRLARARLGWTISATPNLQIGGDESDGPTVFQRIGGWSGGMTGISDGRIAVVDGGSNELRFFDRSGEFIGASPGRGDGPGEFRNPRLVPYASTDTVLVFDDRHRTFTLFTSGDLSGRTFPVPQDLVAGVPQGASAYGVLLLTSMGSAPVTGETQEAQSFSVRWVELPSNVEHIIGRFGALSYSTTQLDVPYKIEVPFSVKPTSAVGRDAVYLTGDGMPEVRRFDKQGKLTAILRIIEEPRPLTRNDIDRAVEERLTNFALPRAQVKPVFDRMRYPKHWPVFTSVRLDAEGWLWAELFRPTNDDPAQWMVFDRTGVARGVVTFPPDIEVHDIGVGYVLGRWLDEFRVEHVRRYQLDRRAEVTH